MLTRTIGVAPWSPAEIFPEGGGGKTTDALKSWYVFGAPYTTSTIFAFYLHTAGKLRDLPDFDIWPFVRWPFIRWRFVRLPFLRWRFVPYHLSADHFSAYVYSYNQLSLWVAILYERMISKLLLWSDDFTAAVSLAGAPSEKGQQVVASSYPLLTMTTVKTLAHNISRYLRYRTATSLSIVCLETKRKNFTFMPLFRRQLCSMICCVLQAG